MRADDLAPKLYSFLNLLRRFWVAVFGVAAAGCGAEPFRLRSATTRRRLIAERTRQVSASRGRSAVDDCCNLYAELRALIEHGSRDENSASFKKSSRILPLKLSMKALWIGLPSAT